jgi:quercetin dioxygenase-like cupin family protein
MLFMNQRRKFWLLFLVFPAIGGGGCQPHANGTGLLRGPPPGEVAFSKYQPVHPYAQLSPGVMTRTLFKTASGSGYRVEIRDLLIGPKQKTARLSLPGPAVFEVRSGSALVAAEDKRHEVRAGSTFSLSEGTAFQIDNGGDVAVAMRVQVFTAE